MRYDGKHWKRIMQRTVRRKSKLWGTADAEKECEMNSGEEREGVGNSGYRKGSCGEQWDRQGM